MIRTLRMFIPFSICLLSIVAVSLVTRPQSQVVTKELHDQCRILVGFFVESVKFRNGIVECLLGNVARFVGCVEDLVVKDGKVKGQTKADGMRWGKVRLGNSTGCLVSIQGGSGGFLSCVSCLEFGKVSVVISLHLVVEYFSFLRS